MTTYIPDGPGAVRYEYATRSIQSLKSNLHTSHNLQLHIADDGSPRQDLVQALSEYASKLDLPCTSTVTTHQGIGASLNLALRTIQDDFWMYTTDDWLLTSYLDLDKPVRLIKEFGYDLVRLGPIHPNLVCTTKFCANIGWWLSINPKMGFAFATRPFLTTKALLSKCGPFTEYSDAYETERLYSERVAKTDLKIAQTGDIPLAGPWDHIGEFEVGDYAINSNSNRS